MGHIITRTNEVVTQAWEENDANWEFFIGGRSQDVHWKNVTEKFIKPKIFRDFHEATYYLETRKKFLKTIARRNEYQWTYRIITEEAWNELRHCKN